LSLLQNWRLEHRDQPGDAVVERIVRQFYTPHTGAEIHGGRESDPAGDLGK
jgi:hypothetical protein